ncbi:seryl-tRNA synthetase [Canariomyces notabilis]|uniref:serine--tRNA ligase n=1 Tax=Canariomyces notabilis TaxID=2074819 RepID=A0AAN6T8A1_9PEZI|nr:seryl-tRNA synthetase [Canariomyces arenarius]
MRRPVAGAGRPFTCLQCLLRTSHGRPARPPLPAAGPSRLRPAQTPSQLAFYHSTGTLSQQHPPVAPQPQPQRPPTAPKPALDLKHIRQNADLYAQNCRDRNYPAAASYPARINDLFAQWQAKQREARSLRERGNLLRRHIADPGATSRDDADEESAAGLRSMSREQLLEEARKVKAELATLEEAESALTAEMERLALAIPNLTSDETPRGAEPLVLSYINDHPEPSPSQSDRVWRSHIHVGAELGLLDFAAAATTSGWGWYYLLDEAAQLEQALVSYALTAASRAGWRQVSPPSLVYSHVAGACGFQPRDAHGETQIYTIAQSPDDVARGKPELCLAGTAEIPLAGMKADTVLDESEVPMKRVAVSRCYRAEAGSRGGETKGLYRVHEFTKVELFAWTAPDSDQTTEIFEEMVDLQTELLGSLGLHCRVLEMPTADLGASATRKCDIEAFFPSRRDRNDGWGEVTSASICTDYQTRRLATRLRTNGTGGKLVFPWTVNGTALAVPRVLAALLENGWNESEKSVTIPEVLRPWMDGREKIGPRKRQKVDA